MKEISVIFLTCQHYNHIFFKEAIVTEWTKLNVIGPAAEINRRGQVRQKEITLGGRKFTDFIRKASINKDGYVYLAFRENGFQKNSYVHRLVANTFISNPLNKPFVNHMDGDKQNNNHSNLEWVTSAENNRHARETGLSVTPTGEANRLSLLTNEQVREIKKQLLEGRKQRDIAIQFNVHYSLISHIKAGRKWGEVK